MISITIGLAMLLYSISYSYGESVPKTLSQLASASNGTNEKGMVYQYFKVDDSVQLYLNQSSSAEYQPNRSQALGPLDVIKIDPPLKQFKSGIALKYITCWEGLQLIYKLEYPSPACVKPETSKILVERGWAKALP